MTAMLIDFLVGDADDGRIVAMLDHNYALDMRYACQQAHLHCARSEPIVSAQYTENFSEQARYRMPVEIFENWEAFKSFAWTGEQHCCVVCGAHLASPQRYNEERFKGTGAPVPNSPLYKFPAPR